MRSFIIAFFFSVPILIYSQKEKTFSFKINGSIANYDGKSIYLHHKWDDKDYTDSARVTKGKFTFNLKSVDPNLYWFTLSPAIGSNPMALFFADKGEITANLKYDSLNFSQIQGGPSQKDYLEYRGMLNAFVSRQIQMQNEYNLANQSGDFNKMNSLQSDFQNLNKEFIAGLKDFVKTHPKSAVSGYIIYNDMNNPAVPFDDVVQSLEMLDKSIHSTKFYKLASKRVELIRGTMVGYKAADFTQNTPDGKPLKLSDYRGKYVLVDFWASWCGPCRMENPNVVLAYNKFKDKGFTVLGVSFDQDKEKWLGAIAKDNLTWDHVSDLKGWGNEVGKIYNITSIPQNVLIDKEGKILAKNLRGPALEEKLTEILK